MKNVAKFVSLVTGLKSGSFVTVEKIGEHKMKKTGNPLRFSLVEKRSTFQVQVGCDLQRIEDKNARAELREARQIGPLPWGEYLHTGIPIIKHKDSLYLRGFFVRGLGSTYTVDGIEASERQLATISLFTSSRAMEKSTPLAIKFENIIRISGGGKELTA
jgi:hypothetical protein